MSDLSIIPVQDWFSTQLAQDWNGATGTVYVLDTPSYTPTNTPTYIVVNPWKTNMQIATINAYDSTAKTLTVSDVTLLKGIGINSTAPASSHATGNTVIISDNYQFWANIQTAVNSKLDITGGNGLVYATTAARDSALGADGVPTLPYQWIFVTATGLFYNYNLSSGMWESIDTGTTPWNATTSSAWLVRTDVAPAGIPVALITDNPKYDALAGTSGTPSGTNKYVTNDDTTGTGAVIRESVLSGADAQVFGSGFDGDVTISSNTSLTRDMYYNNLTIQTGFTLSPKWFRIFVAGTLNCEWTGKIASNWGNGWTGAVGNTVLPAGGTAGAVDYSTGSLPIPKAWVVWGNGTNGDISNWTAWLSVTLNLSEVAAVAGGVPWRGSFSATVGTAWAAWAGSTAPKEKPYVFSAAYKLYDLIASTITRHDITPSGGSGGGGGWNGSGNYGGGGWGSGSTGWLVFISAKTITNINAEALGGNGWTGWAGILNSGGGGGWAGWNGGIVIILYRTKTTVTSTVTWGTAWTGWAIWTGTSAAGSNGNTWNSWVTYQLAI